MSRLTTPWRIGLAIAAALVAVNVALALVRSLTGGTPGGQPSSSYATGPEGAAAYAELLSRAGHPVTRLRREPSRAALDPSETLVLLDAAFVEDADRDALGRFVEAGGRLLVGGAAGRWLRRVVPEAPRWTPGRVRAPRLLAPTPELARVRSVVADGRGAWQGGAALPVLGSDDGALLSVADAPGRVLLLADTTPLRNELLDEADNAALGLALAGPAGRPVRFLESYHGYGEATGFAAVPGRWWTAFALAFAAAVALMLARGRRLGPPQPPERELPPPRRVYVESLGGVLARTRGKEQSVAPVRARALALVAERAALGPEPSEEELRAAGERLGVSAEELDALLGSARRDVLAAGRALARLTRESTR